MRRTFCKVPRMSLPAPQAAAARARFLRRIGHDTPFYQLFDVMPDVSFFAKDRQFRLMCASRRFIERFGLRDEAQVIGRDDFELFPPRIAESFRRDDEEVLRTGEPKLNIVELFFNRQGIPDWFVTNKLPVFDSKKRVIGIMGTVQSFEGRKQFLQPYLAIDRAVAFIRDHFRERISVEQLAALVHLSSRQLNRKFVEAFGLSPQSFIMKLRIQSACEALQNGSLTISHVARDLGFYDQSIFTHHFQKHMGITPLRYQRQFGPGRKPAQRRKQA